MELTIEVLNSNALDLLNSLEKLNVIRFINKKAEPTLKPKHRLSEAEFEAKILAAQASKVSYHFKGDEFNEVANRLLNKEVVDLGEYKRIDE